MHTSRSHGMGESFEPEKETSLGARLGPIFQSQSKCPDNDAVLFTSFFTSNTPYEEVVQALIKSLRGFGLSYYIEGLLGRGSWKENTYLKAYFLREVLNRFNDYRAVVWLDADSVLIRKPELFFQMKDVDFAVRGRGPTRNVLTVLEHCLKKRKKKGNVTLYNILRNRAQFEKCHNCVMYFRRGPGTRQLVDDWISVIEENLGGNDQKALHRLLLRKHYYAKELKLLCLPPTYADKSAIPGADTVIQQYQVSTELRHHGSIQTELRPE